MLPLPLRDAPEPPGASRGLLRKHPRWRPQASVPVWVMAVDVIRSCVLWSRAARSSVIRVFPPAGIVIQHGDASLRYPPRPQPGHRLRARLAQSCRLRTGQPKGCVHPTRHSRRQRTSSSCRMNKEDSPAWAGHRAVQPPIAFSTRSRRPSRSVCSMMRSRRQTRPVCPACAEARARPFTRAS